MEIPAAGGQPQKLGLAMDRFLDLRLHPDGRHIAFTAGKKAVEIWSIENLLSAIKTNSKEGVK